MPEALDVEDGRVDCETETPWRWTRADLDRLITGDKRTWDRAAALIVGAVKIASRAWGLATLEEDDVRDHVEDILLAEDYRRLREIRDPARFAGYLRIIARNRARHVAKHRVIVAPLNQIAGCALRGPRGSRVFAPSDARPPSEFSLRANFGEGNRIALGRALLRFRATLAEQQFRILWLCHFEGLSTRRVAKALTISRAAVRQAHKRAVSAIRSAVHAKGGEASARHP